MAASSLILPTANKPIPRIICSSLTTQSTSSKKNHLLTLISDQQRGLNTQRDPNKLNLIVEAIEAISEVGKDTVTTGPSLSATLRLLWTTEKEQLFIIDKVPIFGTEAGDVLQVIDVAKRKLNNVITFPPHGVFFVKSDIEVASAKEWISGLQARFYVGSLGRFLCLHLARAGLILFTLMMRFVW